MKELIPSLDYTKESYQRDLANVLNWLGNTLDQNDLKLELETYSKTVDKEAQAKLLPSSKILLAGKLAYCINHGAKLEQRSLDKILTLLDSVGFDSNLKISMDELPETALSKAAVCYVNCYSLIDNAWLKCIKNKNGINSLADEVRTIVRKYSSNKSSVLAQLKNHYRDTLENVKTDVLVKNWEKPLSIVYDTIDLMVTTTKASKRKSKKALSSVDKKAEKAATNLTYKSEDLNLGVKSLQANSVIGAKAIVLYNTRNKHCEVYIAQQDQKLTLKGSYLLNFDSTKSCRKTIRKPELNLINWSQANNIRRLEVLLDNTPGKAKSVKGKFNQNIVIIKAIH